ncbi:hypothetical protein F441_01997 [Phytophthora nicotianae CJ01A1]|uniref:Nucleotide-diphospho-sugar transferase domain-containing protein n=6 Tax=Phytophthora nicotianae TaxID=4792 RepID=V9FW47_PHYNI|nr:hypothetical protein F443_02032 [Phytophthora nicotianae P1569]ETK95090.1 hypothetical protein L915_01951 [Phytophthora nicotianae]ETO84010.1 hypothetical protein F444_02045 [Phytophthora nicotianae P1976]ETP25095.1 hypothetical protein F441_01997 [Phytophthora nicotianae CJ01A1]KUG01756.1 hypothetical protein AM587_10011854 [Phytophthora nicotianae]
MAERFFRSHVVIDTSANQSFRNAGINASTKLTATHEQFSQRKIIDLPSSETKKRRFKCLGWRATKGCSPDGLRNSQGDLGCSISIPKKTSGYCEVEDIDTRERFRVMKRSCANTKGGAVFRCSDAPGFANFRVEAQLVIAQTKKPRFALPNLRADLQTPSRGIVMVVYPALVASAYSTIRLLRDVLGCELPIEIWFSPDEMRKTPGSLKPLQTLNENTTTGNLTLREINTNGRPIRFEAKIYAIYHSNFEQVLFLDADNAPVRDPTSLFETPEFVKMGAIFWPDYWHPQNTMFYINSESLVWQLLDMPFVDMFEQESGQILIDRRRHAAPLHLVSFYAFHRPNYFQLQRLAWGDKDLFRFAWLKLEVPFFMIQTPPSIAGTVIGWSFCGMTMVQHDTKGEVLFLHRNQRKLMGKLHPKLSEALDKKLSLVGIEALLDDGYPDPEIWTHLLSFRNTSARSEYIVKGENLPGFPKWQRCYGRGDLDRNPHFYAQKISDLSFGEIEKHLRRYALEAVKLQQHK